MSVNTFSKQIWIEVAESFTFHTKLQNCFDLTTAVLSKYCFVISLFGLCLDAIVSAEKQGQFRHGIFTHLYLSAGDSILVFGKQKVCPQVWSSCVCAFYVDATHGLKLRLHTAINRADFVSWWMWFNRLTTKVQRHFLTECILLPSYVYNMHQDTKLARLIGVCKRTFSQPAVFWTAFVDFRRPLEKDGFWTAVYNIDGFWTAY